MINYNKNAVIKITSQKRVHNYYIYVNLILNARKVTKKMKRVRQNIIIEYLL